MSRDEFEKLAVPNLDSVHRLAMHLAWGSHEASALVRETHPKSVNAADRSGERGEGRFPTAVARALNALPGSTIKVAPADLGKVYAGSTINHRETRNPVIAIPGIGLNRARPSVCGGSLDHDSIPKETSLM